MESYNILIVDDERGNLNTLERTLGLEYNVFSAINGQDALAILERNDIHLIIADHRMPGMTGIELLEKARQEYPDTVRIILTAYTDENLLMDAVNKAHAHSYLTKPWEPEEIISVVRKWRILEAERKRAEADLRNGEEKYRSLIENSSNAISTISIDGIFLLLNNVAAMELGGGIDEFMGRSLYDIFPQDAADEYLEGIGRIIASGVGYTAETLVKLPSGDKWFSSHIQPVMDPSDNISCIQIISQDITERKKAEKRLMKSEKLASIGRLSANLAHELSNPLDGVLRYIRLLLDQMPKDDPRKIYAKHARDGLIQMANMVREILNFGRKSRPTFSPIDIPQSIRHTLSTFSDQISAQNVEVEAEFDENIPVIFNVDVEQIFVNIIKNAIQAMPNGGVLHINARMLSPELFEATFSDTGPGIPDEIRDMVFDPFFTTKAFGQGVGLGLSISDEIAKSYDGSIDVKSQTGRGTTFIVRLPMDNDKVLMMKDTSESILVGRR